MEEPIKIIYHINKWRTFYVLVIDTLHISIVWFLIKLCKVDSVAIISYRKENKVAESLTDFPKMAQWESS